MTEIEIKPMALRHLPQVIRIEQKSFNNPWSVAAFLKELHNKEAMYQVAVSQEELVGYVGAWLLSAELHITNLAIAPSYRRQGIATKLLHFIYTKADKLNLSKVSLEVRVSNKSAQRLYLKEGFIKVKIKQGYYKDNGEDAVVMWKQL